MAAVEQMLQAEFGGQFEDWRGRLPDKAFVTNKDGETWSFTKRDLAKIQFLAIHHSATGLDVSPIAIYQWHQNVKNPAAPDPWPGIGYHFLIYPEKLCYVGDINTSRANVAGQNPWVIGICLIGDFTSKPPPWAQINLGQRLIATLNQFLGRKEPVPIRKHKDFPAQGTECPGNAFTGDVFAALDDIPVPKPPPNPYKFVLGFKAFAEAHPEVGQPVEDEWYGISRGMGVSIQRTEKGVLVYDERQGGRYAKWQQ